MAIVTIQVGQCGNQLGKAFFQTLIEDSPKNSGKKACKFDEEYRNEVHSKFFEFREKNELEARAVLVDMENKVVNKALNGKSKGSSWQYPQYSHFVGTTGSGNNWAHGYCIGGPYCSYDVMDLIRKQVERCDSLSGFLIPMSLAGGTGSGIGSFITEKVKEKYGKAFIMNQVVCPFDSGEVAIQSYNSILTLSHLHKHSDMIVVQENNHLQKICQSRLNIKKSSLLDLNEVASHQMCSILQPSNSDGISQSIGNAIQILCSCPNLKLVSIFTSPEESNEVKKFNTHSWESICKDLRQQLHSRTYGSYAKFSSSNLKSLSNLLIFRGKGQLNFTRDLPMFQTSSMYSSNYDFVPQLSTWCQNRQYLEHEKYVTLVNNSQLHLPMLNEITQKSWNMYNCKAYVHQYEKYSLTEDEFIQSFATMEQIIHDYQSLS